MKDLTRDDRSFSRPSPGQILRRSVTLTRRGGSARIADTGDIEISGNPFGTGFATAAYSERGVMLAPMVVQWHYQVASGKAFAKWLRTKEILLSRARLGISENTAGVHYFGTYVVQDGDRDATRNGSGVVPGGAQADAGREHRSSRQQSDCQTYWGFSSEAAMTFFFELGRGNIAKTSIVETDLREFLAGLRQHLLNAGSEHFRQVVLTSTSTFLLAGPAVRHSG